MKLLPSLFLIFCSLFANAQSVGIGTQTPHPSAALEIADSSKGILIPRMTMAQRNAIQNPAEGLMVYQTDSLAGFWYYTSNNWQIWNGKNNLYKITQEPSGFNCANGGYKIESGMDVNSNGQLDVIEIESANVKYLCNSIGSGSVNPIITSSNNGNFSTVNNMALPSFLRYFGDGSLGNVTATNNMLLSNGGNYKNLIIPVGITAKITPAIRNVIYVQDTLFLLGTINGSGANNSVQASNVASNFLGATASSYHVNDCSSGSNQATGTGNDSYTFSWNPNQLPSTFYQNFTGSIVKNSGGGICQMGCSSFNGTAVNGQSISVSELLLGVHFGPNISGVNGIATISGGSGSSCTVYALGGQGGAGLYLLAKNIVYNGSIVLNGGNGTEVIGCAPQYHSSSAGAGAGSCVISTAKVISDNGSFIANGGLSGNSNCVRKGGNGAMLIVVQ